MAYVFRLHPNGSDTIEHWGNSLEMDATAIDSIPNPAGDSARYPITSIPSPFARMDAFKTALRFVVSHHKNGKHPNLSGDTIYHKLVSELFDVGQIFFNFDSLRQVHDLEILPWNAQAELAAMQQNPATKLYAETMQLFLNQDAGVYNFDKLKRIFILRHKHKTIGATSPATLFFAPANDLDWVNIFFGNDRLFDSRYSALHTRDTAYQVFIHHFFRRYPELATTMPELYDYVQESLRLLDRLNPELYSQCNKLDPALFASSYAQIAIANAGDHVEICGHELMQRIVNKAAVADSSDFAIVSSKYTGTHKPLVLQNNLHEPFKYVSDTWDPAIKVPYKDPQPDLSRRHLPKEAIEYPYLTVSDFLEEYVVRIPYPMDKHRYLDGNLSIQAGPQYHSYLLPLTSRFFEFFDAEDLSRPLPGSGLRRLEISQLNAGKDVKVVLRIPVANGKHVTFERVYKEPADEDILPAPRISADENEGVIATSQIGLTIFPFVRTGEGDQYRVQVSDRNIFGPLAAAQLEATFLTNTAALTGQPVRFRSRKNEIQQIDTQYHVVEGGFDMVRYRQGVVSGVIVPKWPAYARGTDQFTFAVDFGTTNSHIEMAKGSRSPEPFVIGSRDEMHIAPLYDAASPDLDTAFRTSGALMIRTSIDTEFVPMLIGNRATDLFRWPQRTLVMEAPNADLGGTTYPLADFNIPFGFEKLRLRGKLSTNLKWAKDDGINEKRLKAFLEECAMLMRAKVLLNGGSVPATRLTWSYPASMTPGQVNMLQETWADIRNRYFPGAPDPIPVSESAAPFHYYRGKRPTVTAATRPAAFVDIGGGTTDVMVYDRNEPRVLTSFRFAGNALFGSPFAPHARPDEHPLIHRYLADIQGQLTANRNQNNRIPEIEGLLNDYLQALKPEDVNTFLLYLEQHPVLTQTPVSYQQLLKKDGKVKLALIYFHTAIFFHIATMMKAKGLALPRFVLYSGNGSRSLKLISPNPEMLSHLARGVFAAVYEAPADDLAVEYEDECPKEVTAKGAVISVTEGRQSEVMTIHKIKYVHQPATVQVASYGEALNNDALYQAVAEEVKVFNTLFAKLAVDLAFEDYYNVDYTAIEAFKRVAASAPLADAVGEGLQMMDKKGRTDAPLDETLFFYPVMMTLQSLLQELVRK